MRSVKIRLNNFLDELKLILLDSKDKKYFYHYTQWDTEMFNRAIFNLNESIWHKINVPHAKNFEFLFWRGEFYPNLSRITLANVFKDIVFFDK